MPRYALDATRPLVAMVAATMLAFNPLTSESAVAFSQPLLLPFSVGQTWNICWYAYDEGTHAGNYALDIALAPGDCDSGESTSAGESAKSPGDGVIQHKWFNGVCIDLEGPGAFKIGHIDPNVEIGDPVTAGQTVGHVDPPEASNNFVSHLHIEAYDVNYCPNDNTLDGTGAIPFDAAHDAQFQCAPDLYYGPDWTGTPLEREAGDCLGAGAGFVDDIIMVRASDTGDMRTYRLTGSSANDSFSVDSTLGSFNADPADDHMVVGDFDHDGQLDDFAMAVEVSGGGFDVEVWFNGATNLPNDHAQTPWAHIGTSLAGIEGRMAIANLDTQ